MAKSVIFVSLVFIYLMIFCEYANCIKETSSNKKVSLSF